MFKRTVALSAATLLLSTAFASGIALADNVYNDVDASIDATLETMNLTVGGPTGTVKYAVQIANGDGKNGCNLTGGTSLVVAVAPVAAGIATVSPASLTFGGCNDVKTVTVTAVAAGTTNIVLSQTSNSTSGTFDLAPASFKVTVAAAPVIVDTTAPIITVTATPAANANGWNKGDVQVIWTVNDPESAVSSQSGCSTTTLTDETAGTTLTCTATSAGGTADKSVTVKIDKTKPVITGSAAPAADGNGWNTTDVTVGFSCAEAGSVQSGIETDTVAGGTLSAEGVAQSKANTGTCVDNAGNAADGAAVSGINIDKTGPTAVLAVTAGTEGDSGWYVSDVTVSTTGNDAVSGPVTCTADQTQTAETAGQEFTGSCTNAAGLTTDAAPLTVKLDETAPTISAAVFAGTEGDNDWYTSDVTVRYTCDDALSGAVDCPADTVLDEEGAAVSAATPTVKDEAGNESAASNQVTVKIDKTAPELSGEATTEANTNGWYKDDVTVEFSCTDATSGVATQPVSPQVISAEGEGQSVSASCTDEAGLTSDEDVDGINLDKTAPIVTLTTPAEGASYLKNSSVTADWDVSDALSGIDGALTTATAANGTAVGTATTGSFAFTVSATDEAGNTASVTHNYSVYTYVYKGQAPINLAKKDFQKASTIPVKFQLLNSITNQPVQGPLSTLKVNGVNAQSSGGSNVGNQFRYDASAQQYIFNLSTKMPQIVIGSNSLEITVTGVTTQTVPFIVK